MLSERGEALLRERSPGSGLPELKNAICRYLGRSRNIRVRPEQVVIGSGAESLYGMIPELLGRGRLYAIENPAYEQVFDSISQAAEKIQVDRGSIQKCIKGDSRYSIVKGFIFRELDYYGDIILNEVDIEERINQYNNENPLINGERHSISEWCSIYGISRTSYYKRIKKGMSIIEAITLPKER